MKRPLTSVYGALPIPLQNVMCTVDGYRRYQQRFTKRFRAILAGLEESVGRPVEWHYENQWQGLRAVLERARREVPYYRFLPGIVDAGDPYESITKTLAEIPPLEKSVYRARTSDFLARDMPRHHYSRRFTSGTTGTALEIFDSTDRFAENYATVWRQRRSFGVDFADPFLAFTGQMVTPLKQAEPPFWREDRYSKRKLFSIYHMSPENLRSYVGPILDSDASYAEGYPSALHLVSRAMIEEGRTLPQGRLKGVFTSSESLLANQREAIEEAFGAPVRDHYASTEHVVAMTACAHDQLHVDMEFGIVEVEPVEETDDWVRGPLLVTGLGVPAAPMIRYRIGDVGTRSKRPCTCGRPGEVFLDIDGRIEDYVVTPSGRMVGRLDHVFKGRFDIAEAQIVQDENGVLRVGVVPAPEFNDQSIRLLTRSLRDRLGEDMDVQVSVIESIAREPNGKFRAVKSSLGSKFVRASG